ncbi:hypothetical protein FE697_004850 [Mumia zhuanghuii]|uniref:Uncharacterized protein n=2 Tax=Mumia TaxID=1546255 RepID=A0ABW1QM55_9ACTN|nr:MULTISPECIES: hypothetical protein [Mumia]KAA1425203.1 hypothetical protein FE697_004850 [Mumia zhuanghuii]
MTDTSDDVELRITGGLAGTQTAELAVSERGTADLLAVLDAHEIGYDVLEKRIESLPGGTILSVGSFHLGEDGSGLGEALHDYARRLEPTVPLVTIGGVPYEIAETAAVASALIALRTAQDQQDADADEARATWQREYEMEQGAEDSEEPKT